MIKFDKGGRIDEETAYTLYRDAPNKNKEIKKLAELLTCTPTEIQQWLEERGVQIKPIKARKKGERKAWTLSEEKRLMKAFNAGKNKKELAKLFGRSEGAILAKIKHLKNKYTEFSKNY